MNKRGERRSFGQRKITITKPTVSNSCAIYSTLTHFNICIKA